MFLTALTFMWNNMHDALWFFITGCLIEITPSVALLWELQDLCFKTQSCHPKAGLDIYNLPYYMVLTITILLGHDIYHITWF